MSSTIDLHNALWFIIAIIASACPVFFIKKYTNDKNMFWIVITIVAYCALTFAYIKLFLNKTIATIYLFVKVCSIALVTIGGIILFNNVINTQHIVGIIFGIISISLLSL
jgi:hypothetical protein